MPKFSVKGYIRRSIKGKIVAVKATTRTGNFLDDYVKKSTRKRRSKALIKENYKKNPGPKAKKLPGLKGTDKLIKW